MTLSDALGGGGSVGSCVAGAPSPLCSWSRAGGRLEFPNGPWGAGRHLTCSAAGPGCQASSGRWWSQGSAWSVSGDAPCVLRTPLKLAPVLLWRTRKARGAA